jgi:hypothetical protein
MDDDPRRWLFDPPAAHRLVLPRRPVPGTAASTVVSDVVWSDVVRLLRWATADAGGLTGVESGRWWWLAAACADLHRMLPALVDEVGEPCEPGDPDVPEPIGLDGRTRVERVPARLAALLLTDGPVPLRTVARRGPAAGAGGSA